MLLVFRCSAEVAIENASLAALKSFCESVVDSAAKTSETVENCGYNCCDLMSMESCLQSNQGKVQVGIDASLVESMASDDDDEHSSTDLKPLTNDAGKACKTSV